MSSDHAANAAHSIRMAVDLRLIMTTLDEAGVESLAFKGPTLSAAAYERLDRPPSGDLDVLIRREDLAPALTALASIGYRNGTEEAASLQPGDNEIVLKCNGRAELDLHWELSPIYFVKFDLEGAFSRSTTLPLIGHDFRTLGAEDLLLGLAIHHSRHCWNRRLYVDDIVSVLRSMDTDWMLLRRIAIITRATRVLNIALLLANETSRGVVPSEVLAAALDDRMAQRMFAQILSNFARTHPDLAGTLRGALMQIRMCTSAHDKCRYVVGRLTIPNRNDTSTRQSGRIDARLGAFARPVRIIRKVLRGG